MSETLPPIEELDVAQPRRFRWLIRLALVYALLVVTLVAVWWAWSSVASRRLAAVIDAAHAKGEPILAADFFPPSTLSRSQNAAIPLMAASALTYTKAQSELDSVYTPDLKLTDAQIATLRTFPTSFASNITFARQARSLTKADWGVRPGATFIMTMLPYLNGVRELANTLAYSMAAQHLDGDDAEAVELARDILHEGEMLDQSTRFLVEHLVGVGIDALAASRVRQYASELAIEGAAPAGAASHPATRLQVQGLIAELLDESIERAAFTQAMEGERAIPVDIAMQPAQSSLKAMPGSPAWVELPAVLWPAVQLSAARMSVDRTRIVEAARCETISSLSAAWPPTLPGWLRPSGAVSLLFHLSHATDELFTLDLRSVRTMNFRISTERRAAAVALAMRLYQADHGGRFPAALAELVPAYLSAVPTDPFAADGRPLAYVASIEIDGVQTPAVYSVGEDGVDGHASTRPTARYGGMAGQTTAEVPWVRDDAVFPYLRPAPKPADPPLDSN